MTEQPVPHKRLVHPVAGAVTVGTRPAGLGRAPGTPDADGASAPMHAGPRQGGDAGRGEEKATCCPRCDNPMLHMQACHLFCPNCGAHLDCSDKGSFW